MGSNIDAVRGVYEAFAAGDVPAVLGAMDASVDWREPAGLPFEDQVGPQAVAENIFGPIMGMFETFSVTPKELFDAGDAVVAVGVYSGQAAGGSLEADFAHVWRFGPDGRITGFRTYTDTHLWRQALALD